MQEIVRAAAAQIEVQPLDPTANLSRHRTAIEEIVDRQEIDLAVFPELASAGYVKGLEDPGAGSFLKEYYKAAEVIPGRYTDGLIDLARRHSIHLVTGVLEANPRIPGTLYNTAVLVSPHAGLVGVTRKLHIIGEEKHYFSGGQTIDVFKTGLGNIGVMICADNVFPEVARVMAVRGAEIICVPYSRVEGLGVEPDLYFSLILCRAYENCCFFVAPNRVGTEVGNVFEGGSCICGPRGEFLARAEGNSEQTIAADLLADDLVAARIRYARFRDRRPELYAGLCEHVSSSRLE